MRQPETLLLIRHGESPSKTTRASTSTETSTMGDEAGDEHEVGRPAAADLVARRSHIGVTFDNSQRTKQLEPHLAGFSDAR